MKILNLIDVEKSEIKWKIDSFPDGQVNFRFIDFDRKNDIDIITRITSSDNIFILMQIKDILERSEVLVNEISILYLLGARQDRVLDIDQPYTLKLIAGVINSFKAKKVYVYEPHSTKAMELINNSIVYEPLTHDDIIDELVSFRKNSYGNYAFIYPDDGAVKREEIINLYRVQNTEHIICGKKRDKDNKLSGFEIIHSTLRNRAVDNNPKTHFIVKDDLCDGGGTFCGLAPILRAEKPLTLSLYITHAIQLIGIEKVANFYDYVFITNTYKNWENYILPKNVKVIDVLS